MHCAGTYQWVFFCLFFFCQLFFIALCDDDGAFFFFFVKMAYLCCSFVIVQIFFWAKDALLFFFYCPWLPCDYQNDSRWPFCYLFFFFTEWMCRDSRRCFMHKRDFCLANVPFLVLQKFILLFFNLHFGKTVHFTLCGATQFPLCDSLYAMIV